MDDTTPEQWRWIPGYKGRYLVSDRGNVLSLAMLQPKMLAGRIEGHDRGACYRTIYLGGRNARVHRLVMLAFVGPCPPGMEVCHDNGDSLDNRLVNLYYGTPSQNTLDRVRHGTHLHARKTVCPKCGGEYTEAHTADRRHRRCRACNAARMRAVRAARKAA